MTNIAADNSQIIDLSNSQKNKKRPIPNYHLPIIETHCHLDYLNEHSIEEQIALGQAAGVERIVTIAVSHSNLQTALEIAEQHAPIFCSQGIHPHEADEYNSEVAAIIRSNAAHEKVVAIGECGLDYFYDHGDRKNQHTAFEEQLQIASELDLPVVIHTREADEDTQAILKNHSQALKHKGVIHSFTSGIELADFCLNEGFYIGFNGISTFKNADNVRAVIERTPIEQAVLETDAPYLTPAPYRGKENAPQYLPFIAEQLSQTKQLSVKTVLEHCYRNSLQLFNKLA